MTKIEVIAFVLIAVAIAIGIFSLLKQDVTGEKGNGLRSDFDYDVSKYEKVDETIVIYDESTAMIVTKQKSTSAVAIDSHDNIYISGDDKIAVFNVAGKQIRQFSISGKARAVAVAPAGKIYVGYKERIEVVDVEGKVISKWAGLGSNAVITSIAIGAEDVFVADAGNRVVIRYDLGGNIVAEIGKKDESRNIPGFVVPSSYFDLAIADDGLLRVANPGAHAIEAYTFDGDFEFFWGKTSSGIEGFCGCCNPVNFAMLSDGSFITSEKGLTRVKEYDMDGNFVGVVAATKQLIDSEKARVCETPSQCQTGGFDVAVDSRDRVYVLDTISNAVRVFTKKKVSDEKYCKNKS